MGLTPATFSLTGRETLVCSADRSTGSTVHPDNGTTNTALEKSWTQEGARAEKQMSIASWYIISTEADSADIALIGTGLHRHVRAAARVDETR